MTVTLEQDRGVKTTPLPVVLAHRADEYWKLWLESGDPRALLAWSKRIGEANG